MPVPVKRIDGKPALPLPGVSAAMAGRVGLSLNAHSARWFAPSLSLSCEPFAHAAQAGPAYAASQAQSATPVASWHLPCGAQLGAPGDAQLGTTRTQASPFCISLGAQGATPPSGSGGGPLPLPLAKPPVSMHAAGSTARSAHAAKAPPARERSRLPLTPEA